MGRYLGDTLRRYTISGCPTVAFIYATSAHPVVTSVCASSWAVVSASCCSRGKTPDYVPLLPLRPRPWDHSPHCFLLMSVAALQLCASARSQHCSAPSLWSQVPARSPESGLDPQSCLWTVCHKGSPLLLRASPVCYKTVRLLGQRVGEVKVWLKRMGEERR